MDKIQLVMNAIKWINDTFVPRGLTPIEDFPQAIPGEGEACVIARIIRTNPIWPDASVSSSHVHLNISGDALGNFDETGNPIDENTIDMPEEVREFVRAFDNGEYPELVETPIPQLYSPGCTCIECQQNKEV